MDNPVSTSSPSEDQQVAKDTPCRRCSYNLRGLRMNGQCPECGTPVGVSTLGDLLRFSDPAWLQKLGWGLMLVMVEVGTAVAVVGVSLYIFLGSWRSWIMLVGAVIGISGAWLLTVPDPSGLGEAQYATTRRFVRVTLGFDLAWRTITLIAGSFNLAVGVFSFLDAAQLVAILVGASGEFAKFLYLRKLINRIPHHWLARQAMFLQWTYPLGLTMLSLTLAMLRMSTGRTGMLWFVSMLGWLTTFHTLLYIVMIFFFNQTRRVVGRQLGLARQSWASAGV